MFLLCVLISFLLTAVSFPFLFRLPHCEHFFFSTVSGADAKNCGNAGQGTTQESGSHPVMSKLACTKCTFI